MPDEDNQNNQEITIEQLQVDFDNAMNGWRRAQADFENYKRRKEAESKELVEFAREVAVAKLLPTLDALGQAMKHMPSFAEASEGKPEYAPTTPSAAQPPLLEKEGSSADHLGNSAEPLPLIEGEYPAQRGEGVGVNNDFAKKYSNWQSGIKGILLQLDQTLAELGVKRIEALGKKFDPHFHEAVREVESEAEDGTVVEELQHGFELNGKVIRPSQVVISKKK